MIAYTGKLAEQVVNGVTKIVIKSFFPTRDGSCSHDIAGMAHAVPEISGIILLPFIPNRRIILSIKNTTRLI